MGAQYRIEAEISLVRETDQPKQVLCEMPSGSAYRSDDVRAQRRFHLSFQQIGGHGNSTRDNDRADHDQCPEPCIVERQPTHQQKQQQGYRYKTAPEVVHQLPSRQDGQRVWLIASTGTGNPGEQPARQLPIPPYPPVTTAYVRTVTRRELLIQLYIAQQAGASIAAFQEIMA